MLRKLGFTKTAVGTSRLAWAGSMARARYNALKTMRPKNDVIQVSPSEFKVSDKSIAWAKKLDKLNRQSFKFNRAAGPSAMRNALKNFEGYSKK